MQAISEDILSEDQYMLFIHTPFCGTCQLARTMLNQIEDIHKETIFYEMNASLYPEFMQENQIESVPCLLVKHENKIAEKIYAFQSIANIYSYMMKYKPELFQI
ncbi:thioredoxin [Ornithinibacillus sp. L9]|uniref:Thioredoxin n=1 Tax=Ornithinibacillus caprae TaxID=2678566 RepID=A0A6N8FP96_9BACI|nr:thioredoxin family protein [Ornithinibacillus caprae]MUK89987.1 thioredoxin [Ornithinibacillus caprae]